MAEKSHGGEIGVDGAPTRLGKIGCTIKSRIGEGVISASVHLPERQGREIRLRLRAPRSFSLVSAHISDREDVNLAVQGDCIVFPRELSGSVEVTTRWKSAEPGLG
jgi:hypothetical protein